MTEAVNWWEIPEVVECRQRLCEANISISRSELTRLLEKQEQGKEDIRQAGLTLIKARKAKHELKQELTSLHCNS